MSVAAVAPSNAEAPWPKDWINITFLTATPLIAVFGIAIHWWRVGFEWWMLGLLVGMYLLVGMSICAGYHRFYSHKSYECSPFVQVFYAVFGAMAAQNSILAWSSGHRRHHAHVDDDWDPYNIKRGFWWAHILWIFHRNPQGKDFSNASDLVRNPIVRWQDRYYKWLLLVGGFAVPTAIGALFGDAVAGLLWGGFARLVVTHHTTFFVNSLAHTLGKPAFDPTVSARDNALVALLSLGEGYHSFHHKFPADYRNGVRWYHFDPAKWFIRVLTLVGLAGKLRRTAADRIALARERALAQMAQMAPSGEAPPELQRT